MHAKHITTHASTEITENVQLFILHPHKRVSLIQEAQMTSVLDANVHNIAVDGTFDDCQDAVKALFRDEQFRNDYQLGAINSINWARILVVTREFEYVVHDGRLCVYCASVPPRPRSATTSTATFKHVACFS